MSSSPDVSSASQRILVVEDDAHVRAGLVEGLSAHGYRVVHACSIREADQALASTELTLVVLDLLLGEEDAWPLLTRACERGLAVIVLTARTDVTTRLRALEGGAVDYLAKPFFIVELVARIRLRVKNTPPASSPERMTFGAVVVDMARREVRVADVLVPLTPSEYDVLVHLVTRPGRAISRAALATQEISGTSIDSHVSRLRAKLGEAGQHIKTVWGIGWRLDP